MGHTYTRPSLMCCWKRELNLWFLSRIWISQTTAGLFSSFHFCFYLVNSKDITKLMETNDKNIRIKFWLFIDNLLVDQKQYWCHYSLNEFICVSPSFNIELVEFFSLVGMSLRLLLISFAESSCLARGNQN